MPNVYLSLLRVTEACAISASRILGLGDENAVRQAATATMRDRLQDLNFSAQVIGKKDLGERIGQGSQECSLVAYPVEGPRAVCLAQPGSISAIALGDKGAFPSLPQMYMRKLAVGPQVCSKGEINIGDSLSRTVKVLSLVLGREPNKLTICVLERARHKTMIQQLRHIGCRIKLIQDCDVSAAIATAMPESGIDMYLGVGGALQGIISAVGLKCVGGCFQGIMCDKDGMTEDRTVYGMDDLAKGDVILAATGITEGALLRGVRYSSYGRPCTHSLLMRSGSGTMRWIETQHGN